VLLLWEGKGNQGVLKVWEGNGKELISIVRGREMGRK